MTGCRAQFAGFQHQIGEDEWHDIRPVPFFIERFDKEYFDQVSHAYYVATAPESPYCGNHVVVKQLN